MLDSSRLRNVDCACPRAPRKILVYGINFAPEAVGVGRYTAEMAEHFRDAGHEVRVITALPYYPEWKADAAYSKWRYCSEIWRGIRVMRAPLWVPAKPKGRSRVVHLLSFAIASLPCLVRAALWRPHVIWMAAPSLVCAPGALAAAKWCGAKTWLHVQDFEVDIGFRMGMISGGRWKQFALFLEKNLLARFDRLSTISKAMMERAASKGFDAERLLLIPNWVDLREVSPESQAPTYRAELGIPKGAVVALYSGSMGVKQGVDIAAQAALLLKDIPNLHFIFCGNGSLRGDVAAIAAGCDRIQLLPFQPAERFAQLLATADIHLLPQRPVTSDLVMPSKLTGMLASGKPVVMLADPGTELAEVGQACGVVASHGDVRAFAEAIRQLVDDAALRDRLGRAARDYAETHLDSQAILNRLLYAVEALIDPVIDGADSIMPSSGSPSAT